MTKELMDAIQKALDHGFRVEIIIAEINTEPTPGMTGGKDRTRSVIAGFAIAGLVFVCLRGEDMDYNQEYIDLLKRSLASENETVRLYLAVMALAPDNAIPKLLEVQADETDHIAILSDLLLEAVAGQSADQEELVPGVE